MASADPPPGLMDIASTITPDDIPFKLRCATCNKLAVNAFRLPCCDQSICEACQSSLHDTCLVCAHTPVSPDLCKPNKALRTTLKAFLRTEEKKREKDRQATAPPTPSVPAPTSAENDTAPVEPIKEDSTLDQAHVSDPSISEIKSDEVTKEGPTASAEDRAVDASVPEPSQVSQLDPTDDQAAEPANDIETAAPPTDDAPAESESGPRHESNANPSVTSIGPGGFPGMGWNGNANFNGMNPYMGNPMFNFPNPMGMPMTMDPTAANQGMFGDYGMNMTGMGMNMGMNFNGSGMYGSIGWGGSQQNMWPGQDKFNPNAFANGSGPPYGGAFGGSNMSYATNNDFHSGYSGYGRGGFRGRGRGHFQGPGRGGFHNAHSAFPSNQTVPGVNGASVESDAGPAELASEVHAANGNDESTPAGEDATGNTGQLHGIPTIDSLDQAASTGPNVHQGAPGYGRGGYMQGTGLGARGGFGGMSMSGYQPNIEPKGPGVEGAPAAPRAMRQGLPNTSVLRQRGFQSSDRASIRGTLQAQSENPEAVHDQNRTRSTSKVPTQAPHPETQPRSTSRSRARSRSPSIRGADEDRRSRRDRKTRRRDGVSNGRHDDGRSRSPSQHSSRRSSRRRHHDIDRGRLSHRSSRSRRQSRSRSGTPLKNGDTRRPGRLGLITEEQEHNGPSKTSSDVDDSRGLSGRISGSQRSNRDQPSRREEDRTRARDSRHRHRDRRDRERDSDRERRRDRDRNGDRDRVRERERDRGRRGRESDRKRSRRDRSESANVSDPSKSQNRRAKRAREDYERDRNSPRPVATEAEKDPHTIEREARNRERLLREKERREQAKSGSRRDSRQERIVAGRRINFRYEDEL